MSAQMIEKMRQAEAGLKKVLAAVGDDAAKRRSAAWIILIICVVGIAMAFWYHLDVAYKYGHGMIGAKTGRAGSAWVSLSINFDLR